jgi:hypothetical protein
VIASRSGIEGAGEDAVHVGRDQHVDDRDGREHCVEVSELSPAEVVGVERDEQKRKRLQKHARAPVDRGVLR